VNDDVVDGVRPAARGAKSFKVLGTATVAAASTAPPTIAVPVSGAPERCPSTSLSLPTRKHFLGGRDGLYELVRRLGRPLPGGEEVFLIDEACTVAVVDQAPAGPRPVSGGSSRKPSRLPWVAWGGRVLPRLPEGGERSDFAVGPPSNRTPRPPSAPGRGDRQELHQPPAMPEAPPSLEGGPLCLPTPSPPWGEGGASSLHPTNLPQELPEGGGPQGASFAKNPQRGGTSTPRPTPPPVPHPPLEGEIDLWDPR
jgi:hypothetical protein